MTTLLVKNKIAVITGGGRGQGRSHAVTLARQGADIAICDIDGQYPTIPYDMRRDRDLEVTAALVREAGRKCLTYNADVRDPAAMESFVAAVIAEFGHIDILCANAGVWAPMPLADTTDALWHDTIETNLSGAFYAIRAVAPHMIAQGSGRIIATASMCGRRGTPNLGAYTASKWGVIGLVKTAALELGAHGITVNAICPSFVDTPMLNFDEYNRMFRPDLENPTRDTSDEVVRQMNHALPVGSYPAAEISNAVLYLASDLGRLVSGTALDVTAGMSGQWSA
jgi:SDR family mycofactocin-dependent oxidoreductase